jgi:hypothetical protein
MAGGKKKIDIRPVFRRLKRRGRNHSLANRQCLKLMIPKAEPLNG